MTYKGYDVLTLEPNRRDAEKLSFAFTMRQLQNQTGALDVHTESAGPVRTRTFQWTALARTEVAALLAWLDARKGRVVPFWAPTWQQDLAPLAPFAGATITVPDVGYLETLFPFNARRHLALIRAGGAVTVRGVTACAKGAGGTEVLTLASAPGFTFVPQTMLLSFLVLYRLEADTATVEWVSPEAADVSLGFVELPREAPAP